MAFDAELVPGPVVEGGGEVLLLAAGAVVGLPVGDLVLEKRADRGPVLGRPRVGRRSRSSSSAHCSGSVSATVRDV
jgi:hypothetical protein